MENNTSSAIRKEDLESAKALLGLVENYRSKREEKLGELPFLYNVLEEVRVNENAHTRLLMRLLEYPPALSSFLDWLQEKDETFNPPKTYKPKITAEKHRIDGLIQEKGKYAIIIENKVCGAVEQEGQLGRYIDKCRELGYDQSDIYILYLFDRPGSYPSLQTWGEYRAEQFDGRYLVLSYEQDITPWLKNFLARCEGTDEKTNVLREGVAQYLDYLRLLFKIDRYTMMKSELTRFIEDELELSALFLDSPQETIDLLKDKLKSIDDLGGEVERLLKYYRIKAWGKDTEQEYRSAKVFIDAEVGKSYPKFGIHYQLEGAPFVALAEYYIEESYVSVGLGCHQGASEKRLRDLVGKFKDGPKKGDEMAKGWVTGSRGNKLWYGWYKVEPEEAMAKFNELVRDLKSIGAKMVLKSEAE
nr:PD-(D/E)XK nuclease family protein [uncultured Porphyromonas sp.]